MLISIKVPEQLCGYTGFHVAPDGSYQLAAIPGGKRQV